MGTVYLDVKHFTEDGAEHIEITQTLSGLSETKEHRILDGEERPHEDHVFGAVLSKSRRLALDEIENELVGKLDTLFMSDSKGDDVSRAFFIGHLRDLFDASDVDVELRNRVANFLNSVDLFLALLLSVRALPEGEEFADDRVIATVRDVLLLLRAALTIGV